MQLLSNKKQTDTPASNFNISKLVGLALSKTKSDRFKQVYNYPPEHYKSKDQKLKKKTLKDIKAKKLIGHLNHIIKQKTYLNTHSRRIIEKFIKKNNIIDHNMRKKVK